MLPQVRLSQGALSRLEGGGGQRKEEEEEEEVYHSKSTHAEDRERMKGVHVRRKHNATVTPRMSLND